MNKSIRSSYTQRSTPKTQRLVFFQERRDMLKQLVQKQIAIANQLAVTEGTYSRDTMWAWDVVEELSRKLHMVETSLVQMRLEPLSLRDSMEYDVELALRDYDV